MKNLKSIVQFYVNGFVMFKKEGRCYKDTQKWTTPSKKIQIYAKSINTEVYV